MPNRTPTGRTPDDPRSSRTDLNPDEANIFGPDAPNTREDDGTGGPPEPPPPTPPRAVLDHGDFAPDET